jgi:hypothetical protein
VEEPWSFWFKKLSQTIDNIFVMIWCKKLGKNSNIIGPRHSLIVEEPSASLRGFGDILFFHLIPLLSLFFILRFIIEDNAAQKV